MTDVERVEPDPASDERVTLTQFLDYLRASLLIRAAGLTDEQLNQPLATSTLTLAGLLKHLAGVEDFWLSIIFAGIPETDLEPWASAPLAEDPDWDYHSAADDDGDYLRELYRTACARSRAVVAAAELGQPAALERHGERHNLRWILVHMVEETAQHCGHADLLREAIDGVTG